MDKQGLREQLLVRRRAMGIDEAAARSRGIVRRALAHVDWPGVRTLHTYLPLRFAREPDTRLLLDTIWRENPHIKTAGWRQQDRQYRAFWLERNGFAAAVPPDFRFDVIIVPLLGFNSGHFRLGFGGGFYDRFLAAQPQARTLGLCYESGFCAFTPEAHDIALSAIVTEKQLYAAASTFYTLDNREAIR